MEKLLKELKQAKQNLEHEEQTAKQAGYPIYEDPYFIAISKSLNIAIHLLKPPSLDVVQEGTQELVDKKDGTYGQARRVFDAMRTEILKEIL